ncbi:MAG: hypothetical protein IPH04_01685 [Saprospirales bacterium]|nr:hypothetical protein [Saprospirales bacterium]
MTKKSKQVMFFVLLDVIAAIGTFGLFYSIIEGEGIKRSAGKYALLFFLILLFVQFIYLIINFIKSIINKKWIEFFGWFFFAILLGCLIYSVAFVAMIYFGMLGNSLDGF